MSTNQSYLFFKVIYCQLKPISFILRYENSHNCRFRSVDMVDQLFNLIAIISLNV